MEKEVKDEIKSIFDETVADYKTQVEELGQKVKVLEEKKIEVPNFFVPEMYKGRKLSDQLVEYRGKFSNPDMATPIAKALVDMADAARNKMPMDFTKAAAEHIASDDTKGGYLVIDEYERTLLKSARENSIMMNLCNVVNVGKTDTYKVNAENANVTVTWDAEGTVTKKSATFKQVEIAVKRLSGYVAVDNDLLDDEVFDIAGNITEQFSYAMAQELDKQVLAGTGAPCSGVLSAAVAYSLVIGTAGSGAWSAVTGDVFSEAIATLATNDTNNATFVLGKKGGHYVRTLKDDQNAPIFQQIAGPNLNTLFGYPMAISNNINDATGGTGGYYAVFGDFKKFYIVNRLGNLNLLVDPYSDSVSNNTRFIFKKRMGLGIARNTAFVRLGTA